MIAVLAAASLSIAFPGERQHLPAVGETYVIGAVKAGSANPVLVNSVTASVHASGAFIAMVPVSPGSNTIVAVSGGEKLERCFFVAQAPSGHVEKAASAAPSPPRDPYADLGIARDTPAAAKPPPDRRDPAQVLVMIDPGHGGRDSGALSPHGWPEKDANLAAARAIRDALEKAGFRTAMTRDDDSFPELYDRPRAACRMKADAFISVHHNATAANRDPRIARHTVAYAWNEAGMELARAIQGRVGPALAPIKDQGAKSNSLAVCRNPAVPSCLMEIDFINLPEGEAESFNSARRGIVGDAVVQGLKDWLAAP